MKPNQTTKLIGRCGALALAAILSCGAFASCGKDGTSSHSEQETASPKTFTDAGLSITLTDSFKKTTVEGYTIGYEATNVMLLGLKENDSTLKGYTLDQYAKLVISNNSTLQDKTVKHEDGLTCFEFESAVDGVTYSYFATVYQNGNDYWLLQFASKKTQYSRMRPEFVKYAKTVTFS